MAVLSGRQHFLQTCNKTISSKVVETNYQRVSCKTISLWKAQLILYASQVSPFFSKPSSVVQLLKPLYRCRKRLTAVQQQAMSWKFALAPYIRKPETFTDDTVIFYDDQVVIIHDSFAKSACHLLILVRDADLTRKHPTTGLTLEVKDELNQYVERAQDYAYNFFVKRYKLSKLGSPFESNEDFLDKDSFIELFTQTGVHSVPSMANLHIHVMTKDFNSPRLKNKKHYNSFTTGFFIDWDKLPLDRVPDIKATENMFLRESDLLCIYCGKNFSNKFSKLKEHLSDEFDDHFEKIVH